MNLVLDESLPFVGRERYMHKNTPKTRFVVFMNYQEWLNATNPNQQNITIFRDVNTDIQFMIDYVNHKYEDTDEVRNNLKSVYFQYISDPESTSLARTRIFLDGIKLRCPEHAEYILSGEWYTTKKYVKKSDKEIGKLSNITHREAKALLDLEASRKHK